jgi:outer membrane receptor protein involved in Fe transport
VYHQGKLGKLDYSVGYQFQHSDGDWEQAFNGKNFMSEFTQQSGNVHIGLELTKNWYVSIDSFGMKQNIHDPGPKGIDALAPTPLNNQLNMLEEFTITRGGVVAKLSHDYRVFGGFLQAEGNFGHHESVQTNTGKDIFESDDASYAVRFKENVRPWKRGTVTLGADWRRYGGTAKNADTGVYYIDDEFLYDTSAYGLVQQNAFNDMLSVSGGARYTRNSEYGGFIAWQTGAAVRPFAKTKIYTNAAKGFKLPDIRQYFVKMFPATNTILETGTDLRPETYTSVEAGISQELFEKITLNVAGYRIYSKDQFIYADNRWQNAPDINYSGAEANVSVKAFEWLSLTAGYSYIANKQDDVYLPYVPKHRGTGGFVFSMAGVRLQLDAEYVNGLYADTAGAKEFDGYVVANARASYTLWEKYTAFVNLYNITDKEYSTFAVLVPPLGNSYCEYPMPGFRFLAGLSATF